jgi:hypothetical protein
MSFAFAAKSDGFDFGVPELATRKKLFDPIMKNVAFEKARTVMSGTYFGKF